MSLCDDPDKPKRKFRKRKSTYSTGRHAGHRHRGKPFMGRQLAAWSYYPGKVIIRANYMNHEVTPVTNEMWDTHGFIQNWYNPCVHEKFASSKYSIRPLVDDEGVIVDFHSKGLPQPRSTIRATLPFVSESRLDELALISQEKLTSVIDANIDLFNFLRELVEAINGNIRIIKRFSKLYESMVAAFKNAYKRFLKQGHKETAAYWLAWNFAIKPFLKDLRTLLCEASALKKKLQWLVDHNHRIVYKTFTVDLTDELVWDSNEWINGTWLVTCHKCIPPTAGDAGGQFLQIQYSEVTLKYTARSKIFLDIPDRLLREDVGMGALWAAYNGLTNPVGIIWEAIPWSWLIDYFLSYRARLFQHMYDFNPFNEGVTVLGFGHSFKLTAVGRSRIHNVSKDSETAYIGRFDYSLFSRLPGLPTAESQTLFRVPRDWYHASIMGSVLVGHYPKRRR